MNVTKCLVESVLVEIDNSGTLTATLRTDQHSAFVREGNDYVRKLLFALGEHVTTSDCTMAVSIEGDTIWLEFYDVNLSLPELVGWEVLV